MTSKIQSAVFALVAAQVKVTVSFGQGSGREYSIEIDSADTAPLYNDEVIESSGVMLTVDLTADTQRTFLIGEWNAIEYTLTKVFGADPTLTMYRKYMDRMETEDQLSIHAGHYVHNLGFDAAYDKNCDDTEEWIEHYVKNSTIHKSDTVKMSQYLHTGEYNPDFENFDLPRLETIQFARLQELSLKKFLSHDLKDKLSYGRLLTMIWASTAEYCDMEKATDTELDNNYSDDRIL